MSAFAEPDDDFNPENPADPAVIDYCWLKVSADPEEGAYVSGGAKYRVNGSQVYISTSAKNTEEYTYTFLYWTLNGERTSYGQYFYYTPTKGKYELVAHYQKQDVVFDPGNPQDPSSSNIKRKYHLYLNSNIEGACTFNTASGSKVEEGKSIYLSVNYQNTLYQFEGWKLNGTIISTNTYLYYTMPSANTTLEACFSEIIFDPDSPLDPSSQNSQNVDNTTRLLMDIHIGTTEANVDKTRVVINEAKTLDYDTGTDASKMISTSADYQIYSLDANNNKYSVNERPQDNGIIPLGVWLKNNGTAYISASRLDCTVVLKDKLLNKTHDLALGKYQFTADAGTIDNRFDLFVPAAANAVIVTAKSYSIEYGEAIPTFGYSSSGVDLSGIPSISCTATSTSPVGTYPITISKGSVTNDNDTYVNGTLTITKAPLTITAKSYTIRQGNALPTFEATYSGFKNDETSSILTKKPSFSCSAVVGSAPGNYDIIVSGAEASNYSITYSKGTLTVTKADAIIVRANSYTVEYGAAMPTYGYTSDGATLSGTPSISCEATSTSPAGTYPIKISKGSVTNYNDTYVNGTLTIKKAPLTITAKSYTIRQGEALPTFEANFSGFKNNETSSVLTKKPSFNCSAVVGSAPGTYDITVSGAEASNYSITYSKGTLTVTKADAIIVRANSYTVEYGAAMPTYGYTSDGATLSGTPSISCEATSTSPAGTYPIKISKGSVTNYNDTYVNGTLTIKKAPLTITAKSYTIRQGDAMPTFEATYSGFKNKETSSVLTKKPSFSCSAVVGSAPGAYDITVSGAEAGNYSMTYVKGILTIEKKNILKYDVNVDGVVDNKDLNAIVNHIMGRPQEGHFDVDIADGNKDGKVNAADIVEVVKLIR